MTKRHHATNYHRCKQCGQPLVKERLICFKCAEGIVEAALAPPEPIVEGDVDQSLAQVESEVFKP